MYFPSELIGTFAFGGAIWYWWDSQRSREIARQAGKQACGEGGVQFLDDSVVRRKLGLRRDRGGRMQWHRVYGFEFSSDGEQRYSGSVVLLGRHVLKVEMEPYRIAGSGDP